MSKTQILLTLFLSQLFCWVGIHSDYTFIIFPFLFGISIPLANWQHIKYVKWRSVLTLGIMSIALFFGGGSISLWLGSIHLILGFVAIGLTGVAFLTFNSGLISNIQINKVTSSITFILVATSLPIGKEILELFNRDGQIYLCMFSTFFTVLGICLSNVKTSQTE